MVDSVIVQGLSQKVATLVGEVRALEGEIARRRADLAHVRATLLLFDPEAQPEAIRPVGRPTASAYFRTGELTGLCMAAFREAEGALSCRDITMGIMASKGLDTDDAKLSAYLLDRVRATVSSHKRRGVLESVGEGWDTKWQVTRRD